MSTLQGLFGSELRQQMWLCVRRLGGEGMGAANGGRGRAFRRWGLRAHPNVRLEVLRFA
jgi:hypothetical protein